MPNLGYHIDEIESFAKEKEDYVSSRRVQS